VAIHFGRGSAHNNLTINNILTKQTRLARNYSEVSSVSGVKNTLRPLQNEIVSVLTLWLHAVEYPVQVVRYVCVDTWQIF
jgi:hypothetical protein